MRVWVFVIGLTLSAMSMAAYACDDVAREHHLILDHIPEDLRTNERALSVEVHLSPVPIAVAVSQNGKWVSTSEDSEANMYVMLRLSGADRYPDIERRFYAMTYRQEDRGPDLKRGMKGILVGSVSKERIYPAYWTTDGTRLRSESD